ncbi:MAG: HEPN domain-containing protein [Oscillospiraceae bacterium]|nr:HEPN domain-containing protein [Oscillospiraceae bacterium]
MDKELTREWFRLADMDLAYAEHGLSMHPRPWELMSFHCQQAVEKYLKGYLIACGVEPEDVPRTHNLTQLCVRCKQFDDRFDEIMEKCSSLTPYGVQPRYPDELELSDMLVNRALDHAKQVREFAPLQALREK